MAGCSSASVCHLWVVLQCKCGLFGRRQRYRLASPVRQMADRCGLVLVELLFDFTGFLLACHQHNQQQRDQYQVADH